MSLLKQNSKMVKSGKNDKVVFNFGIPAFISKQTGIKTCPNAGACAAGCYARSGTYNFSNVANAYENKLKATLSDDFVDVINAEIKLIQVKNKGKKVYIRIHDSGDFYSLEYWSKWQSIIEKNSAVEFYAYTKQVEMFKSQAIEHKSLNNFTLIFSMGGLQDHLIDRNTDRHSMVFETLEKLETEGYNNSSDDDLQAIEPNKTKVGLYYHGNKSFKNTLWSKVG
jgi:hypothetical protein